MSRYKVSNEIMELILDYCGDNDLIIQEVSSLKHLCCLKILEVIQQSNIEQLPIPSKLAKHLKSYCELETDFLDMLYENELYNLFS